MTLRSAILAVSMALGVLGGLGTAAFVLGGAGMFGSPFSGDPYFQLTLLAVLAFCPLAILPCTILEWWRPRVGAVALSCLTLCGFMAIVLNNVRDWGFAVHDAALGCLVLALPNFGIASALLFSTRPLPRWLVLAWCLEAGAVVLVVGWFIREVGADGVSALFHWLQGGTI